VAALKNIDVAKKALNLARKEKYMDFDVSLGYNYNTEVRNELAPAPKFNGATIGIAIPLKFSNSNKGTVQSASLKASQAENYFHQAELEVQTEVLQNYNTYRSLCLQVARFNNGMLTEARAVLNGKRYSYNRGETSLLEVLNAQRTYNEVRALHTETLFSHAVSLVSLERSTGIWDVDIN
ncbi:MAG: TolC family protein, partial [Bacteroidaceae bacterium]